MEALVLFLCITSSFCWAVNARIHYHHHSHHSHLSNESIALPPADSDPPSESPEPVRNSSNSTYLLPPPLTSPPYAKSPHSSNSTYNSSMTSPPPSPNSSNSTYITPLPSPPSNSTYVPPRPSPPPSPNSANSTYSSYVLPPAPAPSPTTASSPNPSNPIPVFNVQSFGAVGNGTCDDTEAFKSAWDSACDAAGPAVLLAPRGYIFMIRSTIFTGPCQNPITFRVEGTIVPPDGPDAWPANNSKRQWLVFYRVDGLAMQGSGLIDGRGEKWWNLPCKPHKV